MKNEDAEVPDSKEHEPDDHVGINVSGHILIRDKDTGEELVNKRE
jgi:putative hemolysin